MKTNNYNETNIDLYTEDDSLENRLLNPAVELERSQMRLNQPHELLGTFDPDSIDVALEEIDLAYEEVPNLAKYAYTTDDESIVFESAEKALRDEMDFSIEIFTDYFKYNVSPYLFYRNADEKTNFNKKVKKIAKEAAGVEVRLYASDDQNKTPYLRMVHSEEWGHFLHGLVKFEKIQNYLKNREPKRDLLQYVWNFQNNQ